MALLTTALMIITVAGCLLEAYMYFFRIYSYDSIADYYGMQTELGERLPQSVQDELQKSGLTRNGYRKLLREYFPD